MGFIGAILGRREPVIEHRTIDGGHPAPYPDMTDAQLYNYEVAFNLPNKTFDKPPASVHTAQAQPTTIREERRLHSVDTSGGEKPAVEATGNRQAKREPVWESSSPAANAPVANAAPRQGLEKLDFTRPVQTITTRQPVEIITTRARHPVYRVHGYIGDDDIVTVFTLDGQLSEHGPQFLENVPEQSQLYLNIYPNRDLHSVEKYFVTQHASREEADLAAMDNRIVCVPVIFSQ